MKENRKIKPIILKAEFRNLICKISWEKSLRGKSLRGKLTFPQGNNTAGTSCPSAEKSVDTMAGP